MSTRQTVLRAVLAAVGVNVAYLLFWPIPWQPTAWDPPAVDPSFGPGGAGVLDEAEMYGDGACEGPEDLAVDGRGRVFTACRDGQIVRFEPPDFAHHSTVANTRGAPLGMRWHPTTGELIVADIDRGLIAVRPAADGKAERINVLADAATGAGGKPFLFTDALDFVSGDRIVFTDASYKAGEDKVIELLVERGGTGRVLVWTPDDPAGAPTGAGKVEVLLEGMHFANGVAAHPDGASVLVADTAAYQVFRIPLDGPERGKAQPFGPVLPGFPDNLARSADGKRLWVALPAPRDGLLDALGPWPFLRSMMLRLPPALRPKAKPWARAMALDPATGAVLHDLSGQGAADSAGFLTAVVEHDGWLYLGSLRRPRWGRIRLPSDVQ